MTVAVAKKSGLAMPKNIADLLPKARRKPVRFCQNGKTAAVLLSAREYEKLAALAAEAEELEEDRQCLEALRDPESQKILDLKASKKLTAALMRGRG